MGTAPRVLGLLLVLSLGAAGGCATTHERRRIGDLEVHTFRRHYNNAHVIVRGGAAVLIDSGLPGDAAALQRDLARAGIDPKALRAVILTHGHADHAGGARALHERYGVPIVAGAGDREMLARGRNDRLCPTGAAGRLRLKQDQGATFAPTTADTGIDAETALAAVAGPGGMEGRIAPLPGHTPGSLVVLVPGAAFVGDLFRGAVIGSGAETHFYMCDLSGNLRDIRALLARLPAGTEIFVGHFGPVTREQAAARFP